MMEWHDYVAQLLSQKSSFDGISLSFDDDAHSVGIPPIIKASVLILDKMIAHQGKFNILVFPERTQSIFIFTLIKSLHNIAEGKIERVYAPEEFKPGEKLKLGNAVVQFLGIEEKNSEQRMRIKVVDKGSALIMDASIKNFPLFQRTNTQRRLSTYSQYVEEKKKWEALDFGLETNEKFLTLLADYRTHMDSSIVNMTSVINAKELFSETRFVKGVFIKIRWLHPSGNHYKPPVFCVVAASRQGQQFISVYSNDPRVVQSGLLYLIHIVLKNGSIAHIRILIVAEYAFGILRIGF